MGMCISTESPTSATAKLILQDGTLREFPYPVKVSYILQTTTDPTCIICDSDDMDFDDVLTPVREDAELRIGQLYFALPRTKLRRKLQPDEMAALAVKASAVLMEPVFLNDSDAAAAVRSSRKVVDSGRWEEEERRRIPGCNLCTILE